MTNTTTIDLPGYKLGENLYQGTRTLVYRGTRSSHARSVIIKVLRNPNPNFNELVQFCGTHAEDYRAATFAHLYSQAIRLRRRNLKNGVTLLTEWTGNAYEGTGKLWTSSGNLIFLSVLFRPECNLTFLIGY